MVDHLTFLIGAGGLLTASFIRRPKRARVLAPRILNVRARVPAVRPKHRFA
jgi:hypothetical protein